ncbi:MAG: hypothetical protein CSA96_07115 [Bacteroidetes bacterium]|nr:MAG: hypothetical protein CSA96_07115 [Bacteroidota bacterium]
MKKQAFIQHRPGTKSFLLLSTGLLTLATLSAQESLSLEECRARVLEHNHEIVLSGHAKDEAHEAYESARTQLLPRVSATAAYTYLNKPISYDISIPELHLPVGSLAPDGSWTITPEDTKNTWVPMGESYVPLDANGAPFDPREEPEKLIIADWVNVPATDTSLSLGRHNYMLGSVNLTQPIYMGGKIRQGIKMAEYAENIATAAMQGTRSEILYRTDEAYYRILTLEEKHRLVRSAIEMLETLQQDLQNYYDEGLINRNDLLKVGVKLNEARLNQQKVENGIQLSVMVLNQMMGSALDTPLELSDSISIKLLSLNAEDYRSKALENRYEIKALREKQKIEEAKVQIARSRYLPNVVANANYFVLTPNPYDSFKENFGADWSVELAANIPIFHWGDRRHTTNAAKIAQTSTNIRLEQANELISLQVEQALVHCRESVSTVLLAEKNIEQAEENLRIHQENLSEGMATVTEVLEAELMWQKSHEELINARSEMQMAFTHLDKVSGTIN